MKKIITVLLFINLAVCMFGEDSSIQFSKEEMKKCKNTEAFIKFLHPRLCIFAVVDIGFGMEEIMNAVGYTISNRMNCIFILCFQGIWIWFTLMMNKARKEFFYQKAKRFLRLIEVRLTKNNKKRTVVQRRGCVISHPPV